MRGLDSLGVLASALEENRRYRSRALSSCSI